MMGMMIMSTTAATVVLDYTPFQLSAVKPKTYKQPGNERNQEGQSQSEPDHFGVATEGNCR